MDWQDRIIEKWQQKARQQVDLAKDEVIKTLQAMWSQGEGSKGKLYSLSFGEGYGLYSTRHGKRRDKKGLSNTKVNLKYSGTLVNSIKEVERVDTPARVAVKISFEGDASRRGDQDSITNLQLAGFLNIQMDDNILRLKEVDRAKIQQKYGVKITYD